MSQAQFHQQVQQWRELEEDIAAKAESESSDLQSPEDADGAFREALAEKFPQLRAWPGKKEQK